MPNTNEEYPVPGGGSSGGRPKFWTVTRLKLAQLLRLATPLTNEEIVTVLTKDSSNPAKYGKNYAWLEFLLITLSGSALCKLGLPKIYLELRYKDHLNYQLLAKIESVAGLSPLEKDDQAEQKSLRSLQVPMNQTVITVMAAMR